MTTYRVIHQITGTLDDYNGFPLEFLTLAAAKTIAYLDNNASQLFGLKQTIDSYTIVSSKGFSQPARYTHDEQQRLAQKAILPKAQPG